MIGLQVRIALDLEPIPVRAKRHPLRDPPIGGDVRALIERLAVGAADHDQIDPGVRLAALLVGGERLPGRRVDRERDDRRATGKDRARRAESRRA